MCFKKRLRAGPALALASLIAVASITLGACGGGEDGDPDSGNPASSGTAEEFANALDDAPPKLAAIYADADTILEGGRARFEAQLAELEGTPVVVNNWASWCGPCRFEFPFFQSQAVKHGEKIAFLGVDFNDSTDAAETFLEELPLPYPSYNDPDGEIQDLWNPRGVPSTAFYDSSGKFVFLHDGGYQSEEDLAAEIDRYAH